MAGVPDSCITPFTARPTLELLVSNVRVLPLEHKGYHTYTSCVVGIVMEQVAVMSPYPIE